MRADPGGSGDGMTGMELNLKVTNPDGSSELHTYDVAVVPDLAASIARYGSLEAALGHIIAADTAVAGDAE